MRDCIMYIITKCWYIILLVLLIYAPSRTFFAQGVGSNSAIQGITITKNDSVNVQVSYTITRPIYLILRVHSLGSTLPLIKQLVPRALGNLSVYREA